MDFDFGSLGFNSGRPGEGGYVSERRLDKILKKKLRKIRNGNAGNYGFFSGRSGSNEDVYFRQYLKTGKSSIYKRIAYGAVLVSAGAVFGYYVFGAGNAVMPSHFSSSLTGASDSSVEAHVAGDYLVRGRKAISGPGQSLDGLVEQDKEKASSRKKTVKAAEEAYKEKETLLKEPGAYAPHPVSGLKAGNEPIAAPAGNNIHGAAYQNSPLSSGTYDAIGMQKGISKGVSQAYRAGREFITSGKLSEFLMSWEHAWENNSGYADKYHPRFISENGESINRYVERKNRYFRNRRGSIDVRMDDVKANVLDNGDISVRFRQSYNSNEYADSGNKMLVIRDGKIYRERFCN